MLLKLTHTTDITYSDLISELVEEIRMCPRQEADQHRLSFSLAIGPKTVVTSYFDWLGNQVHTFSVNRFHRQIRIVATSVVETQRFRLNPLDFEDAWPIPERSLADDMWDFRNFSGPVGACAALRELTGQLNAREGEPLGEIGLRMLGAVQSAISYEQGVTDSTSSLEDALNHRSGVCQDFSHLMIGLARSLGIPARYVSGLLHPEAQRFKGFTHTHAWCELLFPSVGWVGFDPTNNCTVDHNFVKVAVGRDYRDVPPNKGVYRGKATESIAIAVDSEEIDALPSALAAEYSESLPIDSYTEYTVIVDRTTASQQQEQQQQ